MRLSFRLVAEVGTCAVAFAFGASWSASRLKSERPEVGFFAHHWSEAEIRGLSEKYSRGDGLEYSEIDIFGVTFCVMVIEDVRDSKFGLVKLPPGTNEFSYHVFGKYRVWQIGATDLAWVVLDKPHALGLKACIRTWDRVDI